MPPSWMPFKHPHKTRIWHCCNRDWHFVGMQCEQQGNLSQAVSVTKSAWICLFFTLLYALLCRHSSLKDPYVYMCPLSLSRSFFGSEVQSTTKLWARINCLYAKSVVQFKNLLRSSSFIFFILDYFLNLHCNISGAQCKLFLIYRESRSGWVWYKSKLQIYEKQLRCKVICKVESKKEKDLCVHSNIQIHYH